MSTIPVSRETDALLKRYQSLLAKWQDKINLVSPTTLSQSWVRHFEDSLQLVPHIPEAESLYDLGSGAGFPGLVLAIARPDVSTTLIESDSKKCAFLQAVSRETGVKVRVLNTRIEEAARMEAAPAIITARALASLSELLSYIAPWTGARPDLTALFLKGASFQTEIDAAIAAGWRFDLEHWPSKTDPAARLLRLQNIRKTN